MEDFPPQIGAYVDASADVPDTRTPTAFMGWLVRQQGMLVVASLSVALIWTIPQAVGPWIIGRAIDSGIATGHPGASTGWLVLLAVVTVIGAASGIAYHTLVVRQWLIALYGTTMLVTRKTLQLGHVSSRRVPTGEVLSVSGSDSDQFGAFFEVGSRAVSQLVAYLVVAGIVLATSVRVGVLVLLAAPLLVLLGAPLLQPMQRWQRIERTRSSALTSMATDIVAGLRILRGIGGEETFGDGYARQSQMVRRAGVRAGWWQAGVEALGVLLSGGFVVALMWVGTREVITGRLTVGQLVSFLGYGLFLIQPMRTFVELAQKWTRTLVSARKAITVLEQQPPWQEPSYPRTLPCDAEILDEESGLSVSPGRLAMVVCGQPETSAAVADRLGRYLPGEEDTQVGAEVPEDLTGRAARVERRRRDGLRAEQVARDEERRRYASASSSATPRRTSSRGRCARRSTPTGCSRATTPSRRSMPRQPKTCSTPCPVGGRASWRSGDVACPVASGNAWSSPAPWPSTLRFSSSSNRPRPSTPTPRLASASVSGRSGRGARRSS